MSIPTLKPKTRWGWSNDPLSEFRATCREMGVRKLVPDITSIIAVGAIYQKGQLRGGDRRMLSRAIEACRALGVAVSDQFAYTPLNLGWGEDQDFINPSHAFSADMITINFIMKRPNPNLKVERNEPRAWGQYGSQYYRDEGAWRNAIEKTGPLMVITFGDSENEITIRDILPSSLYEGLYESPKAGRYDAIQVAVRKDMANKLTTQNIANLSL